MPQVEASVTRLSTYCGRDMASSQANHPGISVEYGSNDTAYG